MSIMTIAYCLIVLLFGLSHSVWLSIGLLMLADASGSAYISLNSALLQLHVEDEVRGRVVGVSMLSWGLMPIGALPMGLITDWLGSPAAIAGGALVAVMLTSLLIVRSPALRAL